MTEAEDRYALTLSHEELVVLLRMFRAETLLGLEENPLRGLSEEQAAEALASGERSLRARGIINILEEEQRVEVEPMTLVLLGTCLFPSTTYAAMELDKDGAVEPRYLHEGEFMIVEHSFPERGIHLFTTCVDKGELKAQLMDFVAPNADHARGEDEFQVPISALEELREMASLGKKGEGADAMKKAGVKSEVAAGVVEIFDQAQSNRLLMRADYSGEDAGDMRVKALAFLEGDNGLWLLESPDGRDDTVTISSVSTQEALERVQVLLDNPLT